MKLNEEQLAQISGGHYDYNDLSPEDRAEVDKWGSIYIDEKLKDLQGDPTFNQARLDEAERMLNELEVRLEQKYGIR